MYSNIIRSGLYLHFLICVSMFLPNASFVFTYLCTCNTLRTITLEIDIEVLHLRYGLSVPLTIEIVLVLPFLRLGGPAWIPVVNPCHGGVIQVQTLKTSEGERWRFGVQCWPKPESHGPTGSDQV